MSNNPNTLDPSDKWYCNHSCGYEPPDDGSSPYACYECGWQVSCPPRPPSPIESQLNAMVRNTIKSELAMRQLGLTFVWSK